MNAKLLAAATGSAGCILMGYAFVDILIYGRAIFIEPNVPLASLELLVFAIGGVANLAVALNIARE